MADISQKAYDVYVANHEQLTKMLNAIDGNAQEVPPKTYEEWKALQELRDDPRYQEYLQARRTWKEQTFFIHYGTSRSAAELRETLKPFPDFTEWLEQN